ncbi:hypothetical protein [Leptospira alexanderi]|uniref:hypothetical protein n=1 Tax=Leptospira alexanderi TaxID=100053 RepID=UPI0011159B26|nr:hypothetical protein [Leptospira alexanderi]
MLGSNEGCIRRAFTLNDKFNPEQANFVGTPVREKSSEFLVQKHSKKNKLSTFVASNSTPKERGWKRFTMICKNDSNKEKESFQALRKKEEPNLKKQEFK